MMKLKANLPEFEMVDGLFKGRIYVHGREYDEADIPPGEKKKFVAVKKVTARKKTAKTSKKPANKPEKSA